MKCFTITCLLLLLAVSVQAQSWTRVPPQTNRNLFGCWFDPANPERGSVTGWYMQAFDQIPFVYATTDGGHTLVSQSVFMGGMQLATQSITYTSSNVGYLAGTEIIKTYDGGANWLISLDFGYVQGKLTEITFASPDSGYVVGEGWYGPTAMFFKTANAGASWVQHDPPLNESTAMTCVSRPTARALYAGALASGGRTIFKSTNDGNTWTPLNTSTSVHSLSFPSASTGCAGTDTGILRTIDGGTSWSSILTTAAAVNCIRIKNGMGFAVTADGSIYRSTDAGATWAQMYSPVQGTAVLYNISLLSPQDAYAVGSGGTILRYASPAGVENCSTIARAALLQNVPNPFGTRTRIEYRLQVDQDITLKLYDVQGRELRMLSSGPRQAGTHGFELDADGLAEGAYFYRLEAGGVVETRRLVIRR